MTTSGGGGYLLTATRVIDSSALPALNYKKENYVVPGKRSREDSNNGVGDSGEAEPSGGVKDMDEDSEEEDETKKVKLALE